MDKGAEKSVQRLIDETDGVQEPMEELGRHVMYELRDSNDQVQLQVSVVVKVPGRGRRG